MYPEFNETGNAFFGYHLANNFSRILALSGTAYFGNTYTPMPNGYPARVFDFPIDNMQFTSAPVVQLWSIDDNFTISTVYTRATTVGATLFYDIVNSEITNPQVGIVTSVWSADGANPPLVGRVGEYLKIGETSSELMQIFDFQQLIAIDWGAGHLPARYEWQRRYVLTRGVLSTDIQGSYTAGANIYHVGEEGTAILNLEAATFANTQSWGQSLSSAGSSISLNPSWVEAYLDPQKLRIRYLNGNYVMSNGVPNSLQTATVIFRIFGV